MGDLGITKMSLSSYRFFEENDRIIGCTYFQAITLLPQEDIVKQVNEKSAIQLNRRDNLEAIANHLNKGYQMSYVV